MRKSELVIDALFLTLYQILSCLALYAAAWMFVKIANSFVEVGFFCNQFDLHRDHGSRSGSPSVDVRLQINLSLGVFCIT